MGLKIGNVVVVAGAAVVEVSVLVVAVALAASAAPSGILSVGATPASLTQNRSAPEPIHLPLRVHPRGILPVDLGWL